MDYNKKENILLFDENFYYFLFNNEYGLGLLNEIEISFGEVVIIDEMYNLIETNYKTKLKFIDFNHFNNSPWRQILVNQSYRYNILTNQLGKSWFKDYNEYNRLIKKIINKYHQGISKTDINLITNAYIIGKFSSNLAPVIVSNDEDIILSSHILTSILGIKITILSIYEILTYLKNFEYIQQCKSSFKKYFDNKSNFFELTDLIDMSSKDLISNFTQIIKEGQITCHPKLRKNLSDILPKLKIK